MASNGVHMGVASSVSEGVPSWPGAVKTLHKQAIAVDELKMEFPAQSWRVGFDAEFLAGFAHGSLSRGLAGLQATSGTVDFSGSETALFPNEEDLPVANDKEQRGAFLRLPFGPIDLHEARTLPGRKKKTKPVRCIKRTVFLEKLPQISYATSHAMSALYIQKEGRQWGPFTTEELEGQVAAGSFSREDLYWTEGMEEWLPCRQYWKP